jgi:hypothetical protein
MGEAKTSAALAALEAGIASESFQRMREWDQRQQAARLEAERQWRARFGTGRVGTREESREYGTYWGRP